MFSLHCQTVRPQWLHTEMLMSSPNQIKAGWLMEAMYSRNRSPQPCPPALLLGTQAAFTPLHDKIKWWVHLRVSIEASFINNLNWPCGQECGVTLLWAPFWKCEHLTPSLAVITPSSWPEAIDAELSVHHNSLIQCLQCHRHHTNPLVTPAGPSPFR